MPDTETKDLIAAGRKTLEGLNDQMNDITRNGFRRERDGGLVVDAKAKAQFKSLLSQAGQVEGDIAMLERKSGLSDYLDAPADTPVGARGRGAPGMPVGNIPQSREVKSWGQRVLESKELKERKANGDTAEIDMGGPLEYKDIHSGSIGTFTTPAWGNIERAPMIAAPQQPWRVRSLFGSSNTTAVMVQYVEELGFVTAADNAAAPVPERTADNLNFGLKPKSNIRFDLKTDPMRTIAHWIPAHRNVLDDEPGLRNIIDTRLTYGLQLEEDQQLLLGDGQGENVLGFLRRPGIQLYPGAAAPGEQDTYVDAIRRAATRVMLAEYEATGVVVHPYDWERMELTKDANGNYVVAGSVTQGAEKRLWQMPIVATPACPEGTALVGAFGLAAQVYDRMQTTIRMSEHHEDFFLRNAVVILAEERVGLAVFRPEAMVKVDLTTSIPA